MPKFVITVAEHHAVTYHVEAEDREAAEELFNSGEIGDECQVRDEIMANDVVMVEELTQ